ncbi:MAG: hypothetical protein WDW36_002465 [Sanguina aurantia]
MSAACDLFGPPCPFAAVDTQKQQQHHQHSRTLLTHAGPNGTSSNGSASSKSNPKQPDTLHLGYESNSPDLSSTRPATAPAMDKSTLNLSFQSEQQQQQQQRIKIESSPFKTTGLHRAPLSGGVKTATTHYDLPSPAVAVRNLLEHARFGHLCTMMSGMHHRRAGYPFGTLVDFAVDGAGYPVFCLSPLAIHARNIVEEPKCSLVVQMPGWIGLANARVTIFGDVRQLPAELQASARDIFIAKHANERKERWVSGNFVYFRMDRIVDIYFVGGFGTVQWIVPSEYLTSNPDEIVLSNPSKILQVLNDSLAADLRRVLGTPTSPIDELAFISIDGTGADLRVRAGEEFSVERIAFDCKVHNLEEAVQGVRRAIVEYSK